jgi:hypothetical protein
MHFRKAGKGREYILAKCSSSVSLRARRSLRAAFGDRDLLSVDLFFGLFCLSGGTASVKPAVAFPLFATLGGCTLGLLTGDLRRGGGEGRGSWSGSGWIWTARGLSTGVSNPADSWCLCSFILSFSGVLISQDARTARPSFACAFAYLA